LGDLEGLIAGAGRHVALLLPSTSCGPVARTRGPGKNARFGINFWLALLALGVVAIFVLTEATK
jgi:hypothetical protein